jgi:succinyl-CoA synthetase beta subunit
LWYEGFGTDRLLREVQEESPEEVRNTFMDYARELRIAQNLIAANLKREAIGYAQEVLARLQKSYGKKFDEVLEQNPRSIQTTVVHVLAVIGRETNANYAKYSKFMPSRVDDEFADWWYDLTDAKQFTIVREAMVKDLGVDRHSLIK